MPKELKARSNPMLRALLEAWAGSDSEIEDQLRNTNAQLFVKTAEGTFLDRLASNFGVSRPSALGLLDTDFQKLVPNLSLKAKQLAKSFYDTMDVFWGPTFSRANITSSNAAPFNVSVGDSFTITIDGRAPVTITTVIGDIAIDGAATAVEMQTILNQIDGITVDIFIDPTNGDENLSMRTNTAGPRGSLFIDPINAFAGLGFEVNRKHVVADLAQRTVLYQIDPGELLIELPAVVPTLRRTLKGSHHFHADATIEPALAPSNTIWQGSFMYSTEEQPYLIMQNKALLESTIQKGAVLNQITVNSTVDLPADGGELIFNFGKNNEEQPVSYITIPNSKTILIDPGHTFAQAHQIGSEINLLDSTQTTPYAPRINGNDLAVYLTSPANARTIVQDLLETLAAAGITITFVILLPEYKYLYDNPYAE